MEAQIKTVETVGHVGEFLRKIRKDSGHTIESVAAKAGVTNQTITNMEFNKGAINLRTLLAVAGSLGVKIILNFEDRENIKVIEAFTEGNK